MAKVVYISGAVTGTADYMERFATAEKMLQAVGFEVLNPVKVCAQLPPTTPYEGFMKVCFALLDIADGYYMIPGWERSIGALAERAWARCMGKEEVYDWNSRRLGTEDVRPDGVESPIVH